MHGVRFRSIAPDTGNAAQQSTQDDEVQLSQSQELLDKLQPTAVPGSFIKVNYAHTFQTPKARRQLALESLTLFTHYLAVRRVSSRLNFSLVGQFPVTGN